MPIKLSPLITLLLAFVVAFSASIDTLQAQEKFEREQKIKESAAPAKAIEFVSTIQAKSKPKWYKEISNEGISYEAKFKVDKHLFSVKFDTLGHLLDVEKKVKLNDLDSKARTLIETTLLNTFGSYKIDKIQLQWTGASTATLIELIEKGSSSSAHELKYEVEVEAKVDGIFRLFELLINKNGEVEQQLRIVQREPDNLIF
ncbi:MAG TPA: hypothetical protein ENN24_07540 [Bacteroidetes bacterium]|nr:hypothetical protein [Bacteroidota bacterium]